MCPKTSRRKIDLRPLTCLYRIVPWKFPGALGTTFILSAVGCVCVTQVFDRYLIPQSRSQVESGQEVRRSNILPDIKVLFTSRNLTKNIILAKEHGSERHIEVTDIFSSNKG